MSASLPSVVATQPTTVAILPTQTVLATWDVRSDDVLTVQIDNLDASQTFTGTLQRRLANTLDWAITGETDLSNVPPLTSVCVDINFGAARQLRLVGTMSGAGGDVTITATRRAAR